MCIQNRLWTHNITEIATTQSRQRSILHQRVKNVELKLSIVKTNLGVVFWCFKIPFELMACENVTKMPTWLNRAPEVFGNGTQASITQPLSAPSKRGDCNRIFALSPMFVAYGKENEIRAEPDCQRDANTKPFWMQWLGRVNKIRDKVDCFWFADWHCFSALSSTRPTSLCRCWYLDST